MQFFRRPLGRVALLSWLAGSAAVPLCAGVTPSQARELLAGLPLRFEPNAGQYAAPVRFAAHSAALNVQFTPREARVRVPGRNPVTVRMSWPGANPSPRMEGSGLLPSRSDYFLGNRKEDWRTGVAHYRSVRYAGLYPGVDVVYYGTGDGLEYDFLVEPGADPRRIRIRFDGVDRLSLTPQGDLLVEAGEHQLTHRRPVAYQPPARPVECRYRLLGGNLAALEVAGYDPGQPLVIDPVLVYSSFLGSDSQDSIVGVGLDAAGMVYVAGYTEAGWIPASPDSYSEESVGQRDIFVAKLNPALSGAESLLYLTYLGGSDADTPTAMKVDAAGNVYLTGSTRSTDFPLGGEAPQVTPAGEWVQDAFVVKLNPATPGVYALVYSTYLGGSEADIGYGIDADAAGAIYVAGVTKSQDFPLAGAPVQEGLWETQDGFVAKLDPAQPAESSLVYSTYLGGDRLDQCRAIAVSPSGLVYVAGLTYSWGNFPVSGNALQANYVGAGDIFLTVLDLSREGWDAIVYSTFLGGSSPDEVRRIALAPDGSVLLTGYTLSADFPVTPDAFQAAALGNGDVFLTKLNPALAGEAGLVYSTYLGGKGSDVAYDVAVDGENNVYLTGYTLSADFPVTGDAFQFAYSGGVDVFCTKLSLALPPAQALVYSTLAGRGGINVGYGIAVSPDGAIHLGGYSQDLAFPVTGNALQTGHAGGISDGFILVVAPR